MSMKASELITAIGAALASDSALTTWCTAQFGAAPAIYEGAPEDISAPAVVIRFVGDFEQGENRRERIQSLELGLLISNDEVVTSGSRKICTGLHQVEEMRELVEAAIYRAHVGSVSTESAGAPDFRHPDYVVYLAVNIAEMKTTRQRLPG